MSETVSSKGKVKNFFETLFVTRVAQQSGSIMVIALLSCIQMEKYYESHFNAQ